MKAIEWQRCLQTQREHFGKTIFTLAELSNLAHVSGAVMRAQVGRLQKAGVIERSASGRYALPGAADPDSLLPYLDSGAYITGLYALARHNLVTQIPTEITCFTNRRHNLSRTRETSVGTFRFVCVSPGIYAPPEEGVLARPEQALCDWVLAVRKQGLSPFGQATLRTEGKINLPALSSLLDRYPSTVQRDVKALIG